MVTTAGGQVFRARTAAGIVRLMKRTQWFAPERKGVYMIQAALRATQQTGRHVRDTSPEVFLADLASAGLITVTPEEQLA
jgi:hypothetical protein